MTEQELLKKIKQLQAELAKHEKELKKIKNTKIPTFKKPSSRKSKKVTKFSRKFKKKKNAGAAETKRIWGLSPEQAWNESIKFLEQGNVIKSNKMFIQYQRLKRRDATNQQTKTLIKKQLADSLSKFHGVKNAPLIDSYAANGTTKSNIIDLARNEFPSDYQAFIEKLNADLSDEDKKKGVTPKIKPKELQDFLVSRNLLKPLSQGAEYGYICENEKNVISPPE